VTESTLYLLPKLLLKKNLLGRSGSGDVEEEFGHTTLSG
jgi:hypothetical protein